MPGGDTRERRAIATCKCPLCGAPPGAQCLYRPPPGRPACHSERRAAWLAAKNAAQAKLGRTLSRARLTMQHEAIVLSPTMTPQFVGAIYADGPLTTVEIWIGGQFCATLTAGNGHMDVVCEPGWAPTWREQPQTDRAGIVQFRRRNEMP